MSQCPKPDASSTTENPARNDSHGRDSGKLRLGASRMKRKSYLPLIRRVRLSFCSNITSVRELKRLELTEQFGSVNGFE